MKRSIGLVGVTLACSFLLISCAATQIKSVKPAAGFNSAQIHKILVVSIASTPAIRKQLEEEFGRQWKERGVEAVASSAVLPSGVTLDKAGIEPFAKAQGFDSVLVTRVMKRQKVKAQTAQPAFENHAMVSPEEDNLTEYIDTVVASPEYDMDYEVVILRTNIYDVGTEKQIWSCISNTLIAQDVPKQIGPFVKIILKNVYRTHA